MHPGAKAEPVLVAWGFDTTGKPQLIGLEPGNSESTDAWGGFLRSLLKRDMRPPLLVTSDGGPGLISASRTACANAASFIEHETSLPRCRFTPRPR